MGTVDGPCGWSFGVREGIAWFSRSALELFHS